MNIRLKRNESFSIREGWFEKAINSLANREVNVFSKNNGSAILGIGTNMVKALKYWLIAANIAVSNNTRTALTEFGEILYEYDRYLEDKFSWQFIHYFLARNFDDSPVCNAIFNSKNDVFTKKEILSFISILFKQEGHEFNASLLEDDISVFVKTYFNEDKINNPEDNYSCPLASLKLLSKNNDEYKKIKPIYRNIDYLCIYFALSSLYSFNSFEIDESIITDNSPYKLFNLDKNMYLQYLDEMKKNGLITVNKTAGLNTVYFEERLNLRQIFAKHFGG